MRKYRKISRRSFMATVAGGAVASSLVLAGRRAEAHQGCSDTDPISRGGDPGGRGRNCASRPVTGCSDRDPTDPGMRGQNCGSRRDLVPCNVEGCGCPDYTAPAGGGAYSNCARCGHRPNYHLPQ